MWWHVDAKGMTVGRLATQIAMVLMGKHKPVYDPAANHGDFVVVTNAADAVLTGRKDEQKLYRWHTGYPGGLKEVPAEKMREKKPEEILRHAVNGMLPKNRLRRERINMLRVFEGAEHKHEAQQPQPLPLQHRTASKY
jgi:large subunit ribosomal protein L13